MIHRYSTGVCLANFYFSLFNLITRDFIWQSLPGASQPVHHHVLPAASNHRHSGSLLTGQQLRHQQGVRQRTPNGLANKHLA